MLGIIANGSNMYYNIELSETERYIEIERELRYTYTLKIIPIYAI